MGEVADIKTGKIIDKGDEPQATTLRSILPETRNGRFALVAVMAGFAIAGAFDVWRGTPSDQQADAFRQRELGLTTTVVPSVPSRTVSAPSFQVPPGSTIK